jgi:hypothetical protein
MNEMGGGGVEIKLRAFLTPELYGDEFLLHVSAALLSEKATFYSRQRQGILSPPIRTD